MLKYKILYFSKIIKYSENFLVRKSVELVLIQIYQITRDEIDRNGACLRTAQEMTIKIAIRVRSNGFAWVVVSKYQSAASLYRMRDRRTAQIRVCGRRPKRGCKIYFVLLIIINLYTITRRYKLDLIAINQEFRSVRSYNSDKIVWICE